MILRTGPDFQEASWRIKVGTEKYVAPGEDTDIRNIFVHMAIETLDVQRHKGN